MRVKKILYFFMLLLFIMIASLVPFPINFYKKDNLPKYTVEQIDKKEDEDEEEDDYQAFS